MCVQRAGQAAALLPQVSSALTAAFLSEAVRGCFLAGDHLFSNGVIESESAALAWCTVEVNRFLVLLWFFFRNSELNKII